MDDHTGKDVALPERVLSEYKEGMAHRLNEFTGPHINCIEVLFPESQLHSYHENRRHTSRRLDRSWHKMWEDC